MAFTSQHKPNAQVTDWILAVTSLALALTTYFAQMKWFESATHRETVMISTVQFVFTAALGYFTNKIASGDAFQRSIKQFAVGAYRRASDIENMIARLQRCVASMKADRPRSDAYALEVIGAIVDDAVEVIGSSKTDWADVIGDEMIAVETITELETERVALERDPVEAAHEGETHDDRLKKIEAQIHKLEASLPPPLRYDAARAKPTTTWASVKRALRWLADGHEAQGGLHLRVVLRGELGRDPSTLSPGEPLTLTYANEAEDIGIDVKDRTGALRGRVANHGPSDYIGFRKAMAVLFGDDPIPARYLGPYKGGEEGEYEVQVMAKPNDRRPEVRLVQRRK
jgi:hypothetical protein